MRKVVLLLLGVGLLLGGCRTAGSPAPVFTPPPPTMPPTPSPQVLWATYADWQTYRDEALAFAIQYPTGWAVYTFPERPGAVYFGPAPERLLAGVRVVEGVTLEETVAHQIEVLEGRVEGELLAQQTGYLNGYPGVRLTYRSGEQGPLDTWVLAYEGRVYIVGAAGEEEMRTYEEMLATFHFLERSP